MRHAGWRRRHRSADSPGGTHKRAGRDKPCPALSRGASGRRTSRRRWPGTASLIGAC